MIAPVALSTRLCAAVLILSRPVSLGVRLGLLLGVLWLEILLIALIRST